VRLTRPIRLAVLAAALATTASGCAVADELAPQLCQRFEGEWNDFVASLGADRSSAATRELRDAVRQSWKEAAEGPDLSKELTALMPALDRDLMFIWNGLGGPATVVSFWNGMDIVADRCSAIDSPVIFSGRDLHLVPREPKPALGSAG
jgi:hypothetical protein